VEILQLHTLRFYLQSLPYRTALQLTVLKSNSKSKLLYDWWFTANQFVLASSLLRLTTRGIFFNRTFVVIILI
jgi:hypothetical protein